MNDIGFLVIMFFGIVGAFILASIILISIAETIRAIFQWKK